MTDVQRDIGYHDAKIEALEQEVRAMRQDVAAIKEILAQTKGGIRTIVGAGAVGAAIATAAGKAFAFLKGVG